jgi:hypothetical protein
MLRSKVLSRARMAETTGVHIVEIRAGESQRPVLELRPGVVVQPMSVGRVGMWSVNGPGVLDVHAYFYFDGRALFVQSADAANPAKGNGKSIGTSWQQIEIPCTLELGRARLVYRTLDEEHEDDDDKTVAQPIQLPRQPQQQFTPNAGTFSNRNQAPDSDATRLQPIKREPDPTVVSPLEAGPQTVPKARPAAGMPAWSTTEHSPVSSPTTIGAPPQAPAPPPPQNTGYQAFGSVQVAVPAVPVAPSPMVQPMGTTLQSPLQSPIQQPPPMLMHQQPMQPGYGMHPNAGPGMMPPGMMPPGMMPPGMMPPGMMPPGMMPGMMQPGMGPPPGMPFPAGSGPLPMGAPGPNAETGRIQPPSSELKGFAKAVAEWKEMPPLRKFIIGTFPGVALLVYFMLFDEPPPRRLPPPVPSGSVSAVASNSATPSATPSPSGSVPAVPSGSSSVALITTNTAPITSTVPSASAAPPPPPTATAKPAHLPKGKKTLERQAIDLVAEGKDKQAAQIYDQLAKDHPEQPAFAEAARLLRLRGASR